MIIFVPWLFSVFLNQKCTKYFMVVLHIAVSVHLRRRVYKTEKICKFGIVLIWKRHFFSAKQTYFSVAFMLPWIHSAIWSMMMSIILEGVLENSCLESCQVKFAVKIFEKYLWKSLFLVKLLACTIAKYELIQRYFSMVLTTNFRTQRQPPESVL